MNALVVVAARMGSWRLPGKVLAEIGNHTALRHVVTRAVHADVGPVVVACPASDYTEIASAGPGCLVWGCAGDEDDVLGRYAWVTRTWGAGTVDAVVRLTADCPFVDVAGIRAVALAVGDGMADYAATFDWRRGQHRLNGLDAEAFTPGLLFRAAEEAASADREHVTSWMQREVDDARKLIVDPLGGRDVPPYRLLLDTPEDLAWFRAVAEEIAVNPPKPETDTILTLLGARPDLVRLMQPEEAAA